MRSELAGHEDEYPPSGATVCLLATLASSIAAVRGARRVWWLGREPQAVIDRFGADGARLRGPDVTDRDDRGPTLEIERTFDIPN